MGWHIFELKRKRENKVDQVKSFLLSIQCEMETLWDFYMRGIGEKLDELPDQPEAPLRWFWSANQGYFTIYDNNASILGEIKNDNLRSGIISAYNGAKAMIDQFQFYNRRLEKYTWLEKEASLLLSRDVSANYAVMKKLIIEDTANLKIIHKELKRVVTDDDTGLLSMLKKEINDKHLN